MERSRDRSHRTVIHGDAWACERGGGLEGQGAAKARAQGKGKGKAEKSCFVGSTSTYAGTTRPGRHDGRCVVACRLSV